ncbi:MAG: aminotransferase class I/II-fold pyridoxal phosphate-dependent enzyme, partial [Cyclobacteriaceae bacterium]|nr:aminotransferase class I/II-fold pyridoxal phosphate-dependent enzyme [Cyclobacteriaceae bacterium]
MTSLNRRDWIKSTGILGSATAIAGLGSFSNVFAEEKKFNSRALKLPIKLNSNENPFGPSERVRQAMQGAFDDGCRYPFAYSGKLLEQLAEKEGVTTDHIVITGGSTEGLKIAGLTYGLYGGEILAPQPTFLAMMNYGKQFSATINWVPVGKDMGIDLEEMNRRITNNTKLIFICNPNNPTSTLLPAKSLVDFCESASKETMVFSDEAYYDFIEEENYPSMVSLVKKGANVIVSRTFSKVYGLAGIRIGYLIARPDIANRLRENVVANTNILALSAASEALNDTEFYQFSIKKNKEAKALIYKTLDDLKLKYIKSHTNFVFFHTGRNITALMEAMKNEGVLIGRPFPPFTDWCRISTGTIEE